MSTTIQYRHSVINTKLDKRKQQHRGSGADNTSLDNSLRRAVRRAGASEYKRETIEYFNVLNETSYDASDFTRVYVFEQYGVYAEAWAETPEGQMVQIIEGEDAPLHHIRNLAELHDAEED